MTVEDTAVVTNVQALAALAREQPDHEAYRHIGLDGSERVVTWSWLDDRSSRLAGALAERGVGHGDRVGLGLRNSPEFLASVVATWKVGAVPVPVRWDVPDWELARLQEVIAPKLYLGADDLDWIASAEQRPVPELPDVVSPHLQGICSSGSTGTPKIILSSAPAVVTPSFSTPFASLWMPVPRPQTILVLAPMYHINAFATIHSMLSGDRLVVMEKFDAGRALDVIEAHRVSTFTATPTMLQRMADRQDAAPRDLSSIVYFIQGAAPMPPSLVRRWASFIGAEKIIMAYGMTEGLGLTALNGSEYLAHEGSVGRPLPGTEVRIQDGDRVLPSGEVGEIWMRSPSSGGSTYLGDVPQLPTTDDGFRTVGDMGYLEPDGFLHLVDRRVDLIITGGANVFPAEVEKALIDHPGVADVVVIGLRDPEWGRRVHAIIEPADHAAPPEVADVIAFARTRLAAYKVPKTVEYVDAVPRSEATKVNRGRLVEARGG